MNRLEFPSPSPPLQSLYNLALTILHLDYAVLQIQFQKDTLEESKMPELQKSTLFIALCPKQIFQNV